MGSQHDLWGRAEALFHAAVQQAPETIGSFLDEACEEDAELRERVEMLLSADKRAGGFLETPILADSYDTRTAPGALVGSRYGPYRVEALLDAGGMGEVYRAHDSALGRDVAIKLLPPEFARDPERLARFRREARILAALNHPNIAAIYGFQETEAGHFLVLELVPGEKLEGPLPLATALDRAGQVAEALAAAHEHGIIHRDLKPANVKVTPQGVVKVLDFGLAKAIDVTEDGSALCAGTETVTRDSNPWILGTPAYVSPEQARGDSLDQRTDIWSFGCLLYELLTGKRAFAGQTVSDTIAAVLEHEPDWRAMPAGTPVKLRRLLRRCLEKDAGRRLSSIRQALAIVAEVRRGLRRRRLWAFARRPRYALLLSAIAVAVTSWGVRFYQQQDRARWVREQATPEIRRLLESREFGDAFRLIRRAEAALPGDPTLNQLRHNSSLPISLHTNPPGAEVWATGYAPDDNDWIRLGTTPCTSSELFLGFYRFRIVKPGYETILASNENRGGASLAFDLDPKGAIPREMVRVTGGTAMVAGASVELNAFLIDRYEVVNRQYKEFIDRGGYRNREYWKEDLVRDGRKLSWDAAMQLFLDSTGRPGPSTWEIGDYPPGHDDYPVNGVSWYEAAAYARFAEKQLPTVYHWQRAADPGLFTDPVVLSNFGGAGPAPVGAYRGLGAFGTFDLAGNVKEWCRNEIGGRRYVRGGAWNEPSYMFLTLDARDPWDRSPQNGIRCVRYDTQAESGLQQPVAGRVHDYTKEKPVSDDVFRLAYRNLYAYDPRDLDTQVEGVDEENSYWKREKVSFVNAYGNERVYGYFYMPKRSRPPYQTIIYASPGLATRLPSPQPGEGVYFDFVVKSGRAFLVPVLKGQYQRRYATPPAGPIEYRDRLVVESKDFRRCIDYLVSRPDVDRDRLGVLAVSRGYLLPVLAVGERRLKAAALIAVGLPSDSAFLPEDDPFNFVPRFQVPSVMINGRNDFLFPLEASQLPMFRWLGAPNKDKRHVLWDGSHSPLSYPVVIKETLDWFDKYLGPVQ